jgi:hypothetical protein
MHDTSRKQGGIAHTFVWRLSSDDPWSRAAQVLAVHGGGAGRPRARDVAAEIRRGLKLDAPSSLSSPCYTPPRAQPGHAGLPSDPVTSLHSGDRALGRINVASTWGRPRP